MKVDGKWIANIFKQEVPSGTVDGANTSFSLSLTPHSDDAVMLYRNSILMRQTLDYTISGSSITMLTAPELGQDLYAFYIKG